jgi:hypothetical protein
MIVNMQLKCILSARCPTFDAWLSKQLLQLFIRFHRQREPGLGGSGLWLWRSHIGQARQLRGAFISRTPTAPLANGLLLGESEIGGNASRIGQGPRHQLQGHHTPWLRLGSTLLVKPRPASARSAKQLQSTATSNTMHGNRRREIPVYCYLCFTLFGPPDYVCVISQARATPCAAQPCRFRQSVLLIDVAPGWNCR